MKVYKIRDKETGLYLCGGSRTSVNKEGATYSTLGAARGRAKWAKKDKDYWTRCGCPDYVGNHVWEIVEFEVTETELRTIPVTELSGDKQ